MTVGFIVDERRKGGVWFRDGPSGGRENEVRSRGMKRKGRVAFRKNLVKLGEGCLRGD